MPCAGTLQTTGGRTRQRSGSVYKIGKAATLVMLQPWTPARELPAWTHVPSQPLIRSPLSQFQTSADISQRRRFFQVWRFRESPRSPTDQSSSGGQRIIEAYPFRPSTVDLPHWLCSDRELLRESCRRGRMYRSGPGCDHCFRSSRPRRTSRNAVDFFGSGGSASRLAYRSLRLTSSQLPIGCRSFLPSTKLILTEHKEKSTPKVCADPTFSRLASNCQQAIVAREVPDQAARIFYNDSHLFHRRAMFQWRRFSEPNSRLDESEQMNDLIGEECAP